MPSSDLLTEGVFHLLVFDYCFVIPLFCRFDVLEDVFLLGFEQVLTPLGIFDIRSQVLLIPLRVLDLLLEPVDFHLDPIYLMLI